MKVVLLVALLAGLCVADFAYLTYYSDKNCNNFSGSRAMTQNDQAVVGASGNSCSQELYCLFDPLSSNCLAVANGVVKTISISTQSNSRVEEFVNGDSGTVYSESDCTESSIFESCYFRYYTENTVDGFYTDSCGGNGGSSGNNSSPASTLVISALAVLAPIAAML